MIETLNQKPKPFHIENEFHQIITDGGMGDLICELVAVDYNIRNHRKVRFHVWVPDYLHKFASHLLTPGAIIKPFSEATNRFRHDIEGMTTEWCTNHTCMRTHPVDYGFHMLSDRHLYDMNQKNYLQIKPDLIDISRFSMPIQYVCIVATSAEACKAMPAQTINAISDFALSKGYTPVFLGKEKAETGFKSHAIKASAIPIDYTKGINLINQTDMLEAAAIISGAKCFIGMDGGLTHLAGCTDAPIIAGYTIVDPVHVAPIRKGSQSYKFHAIEPEMDIPNRYYQTYKSGFKKGDFRQFPGWQKVIASMTPDKFIKVLETVL